MFEGFERRTVAVGGIDIACVIGGSGPPVLLLHGAADTRVSTDNIQDIYRHLPGKKQLESFPGLNHESYVATQPQQWKSYITGEDLANWGWRRERINAQRPTPNAQWKGLDA